MKETINFELTSDDYHNLSSVLNIHIGYLESSIKSNLRFIEKHKEKIDCGSFEKIIAHDEKELKECSALYDKLKKIYYDKYFL